MEPKNFLDEGTRELDLEVGSSVGRKGRRGIPREGAVLSIRKLFHVQEGKMGIHFNLSIYPTK